MIFRENAERVGVVGGGTLKRKKSGKAVDAGDIPVEVWKNKGGVQSCGNSRAIALMNHTLSLWERAAETK